MAAEGIVDPAAYPGLGGLGICLHPVSQSGAAQSHQAHTLEWIHQQLIQGPSNQAGGSITQVAVVSGLGQWLPPGELGEEAAKLVKPAQGLRQRPEQG